VAPGLEGRGALLEATAGARIGRAAAAQFIAAAGAGGAFTARYDVRPYAVRYRTPGVDGALTTASGAVYLPVGAPGAVPVLAYQHGTVTARASVPSSLAQDEGRLYGAAYGSDGFAVVLPDYLGLGTSDAPFHPYLHVATQASAAVDLLRAARALAAREGAALDPGSLYLTGYSQGGAAAQGLHRALERDHAAEFPVRASAPMSGPYDLSGTARGLLAADPAYLSSVLYTAYLAASMTRTYQLTPRLAEVLVPPVAAAADALLAGTVRLGQLAALPGRPRAALQPALLAALAADAAHPFWRALGDNDVLDWAPRAPVRLYFGGADRDVPPANAATAESRMRAAGAANVAAVSVGAALDHGGAVLPATLAGKRFIDSVRAGLVR
jgi:hypothetical protein